MVELWNCYKNEEFRSPVQAIRRDISTYESEHTTLYPVVVVEDYYMLLISFRFFSMLHRADFFWSLKWKPKSELNLEFQSFRLQEDLASS